MGLYQNVAVIIQPAYSGDSFRLFCRRILKL